MASDRNRPSFLAVLMTLILAFMVGGSRAAAQTEQVLYSFTSEPDGIAPQAGLVIDKSGDLYGTTATGLSTVFKVTPPTEKGGTWAETTIYSFPTDCNDGCMPQDAGSLVLDESGTLYGTTHYGGEFGFGTVFQLAPPSSGDTWTESVIYSFAGGADAQYPYAGLTMAGGTLYGTTYVGGEYGAGTVFRLKPPTKGGGGWTETVLYSFTGGIDGGTPYASPTVGASGVLYGTTKAGGLYGGGVVYRLSSPAKGSTVWTESVLHSFPDSSNDGFNPMGAVILGKNGALYGTTEYSNNPAYYGTVFELAPQTWEESTLYNFTDGSDGEYPEAGLVLSASGTLYGTTTGSLTQGGNEGSVFKLTPPTSSGDPWTETTLHAFAGGSDGGAPFDTVSLRNGLLYGTTYVGGPDPSCNCGVVFEVNPQ
ncbi:MAG: choice-of-anchor tandem repeat GloVer-containing protein [Candidatus Sulfotelmatobacter sp.]